MHKPESVQDNETDKITLHIEIKRDNSIPAKRRDFVKKKRSYIIDCAVPVNHKEK